MPLRFTKRVLDHLKHSKYEPSTIDAIARDMRIDDDELEQFRQAVHLLAKDEVVALGKDKLVRLPSFSEEVTGVLRLKPRGFGFVRTDHPFREGDLFIPPGGARDAISGDRVRARVVHSGGRRGERVSGRILEVLERGRDQFVGVLTRKGSEWFMKPDGNMLRDPVLIRDPHAKNAKPGDKIVVELVHYPEDDYVAEGVITKVLGIGGKPDVETQAVIVAHGLRTEFPDSAMDEARDASRNFDQDVEAAKRDREDLTDTFIFTIDPPDAKDFDDAISLEYDESQSEWTLGVHIADVSSFVAQGGALDEEARERANSTYLPRLVLPMLPETLSNGVCSLQEQVDRMTKSAFITFDNEGNVRSQRFASTVIRSRKRLTYIEAQALIDGDSDEAEKNARTKPEYSEELIETLRRCDKLAKILQKRRMKDGMIVLALPEVELVFDDDGHVVDAVPEDDVYTHKIIEMFMVEANEAVARLFSGFNVPVLRRIHPDPVHGDIEELQMYARSAKWKLPDEPTRKDLQALLEVTRHTPASRAVHFAVLRTLSKATYSPALIGHFALASEHYLHFTSPIRRYPDLTAHRALQALLEKTDNGTSMPPTGKSKQFARRLMNDDRVLDEGELIVLGTHCSDSEVESEGAERELRAFLVMQFLREKHLGDDFTGVITGISGAGVFVSIEKFLVEGLIKTADLPQSGKRPDRWRVDQSSGRLVAERSGAAIGIGDIVTVQVTNVDLPSRQLDLLMTELPANAMDHGTRDTGDSGKSSTSGQQKDRRQQRGSARGSSKGKRGTKGRSRK